MIHIDSVYINSYHIRYSYFFSINQGFPVFPRVVRRPFRVRSPQGRTSEDRLRRGVPGGQGGGGGRCQGHLPARGIPNSWMIYKGKSEDNMDDLGVPPILGNNQMYKYYVACKCT